MNASEPNGLQMSNKIVNPGVCVVVFLAECEKGCFHCINIQLGELDFA